MKSGLIVPSQKNSLNRSCNFANNEIVNNSSMNCCKIMMYLIFKGNDWQVDNSSTCATGYILWIEKTGLEFVLPISSPGLHKNVRSDR